jgi:hypothetical protein
MEGATIHSDQFATYFNLNDAGYSHTTVERGREGFWGNSKHHFKQIRGVNTTQMPAYLDELVYRWSYKNTTDHVMSFSHDVTVRFNTLMGTFPGHCL